VLNHLKMPLENHFPFYATDLQFDQTCCPKLAMLHDVRSFKRYPSHDIISQYKHLYICDTIVL